MLLFASWGALWIGVAILAFLFGSPGVVEVVASSLCLSVLTFVALLLTLDRWPVKKLVLGGDLLAMPTVCFPTAEIAMIHFEHDPDEDYIEDKSPIRLKRVTIEHRRGRKIRITASAGDSLRLREWAESKGVKVEDPD